VAVYLPESFTWATEEHFIKSPADLRVMRYWYEDTSYTPAYGVGEERRLLVGDAGVVLSYLPKSPLMELVALHAGIETVVYAFSDARDELEETLAVMERKADEAALVATRSPAECLMIPENLSSEMIGKSLFERFMRPYEEKWVSHIREAGKRSFVHMDGTLNGLIAEVASTGFDVLEALTPSPVGDLPLDQIARRVPESSIIWGGLPGVYFTDLVNDAAFEKFVIETLSVMKSQPRFVLGVADQVPPGARRERIGRVAELIDEHGRY
jgi:uroporphyrinogen-III decarboxylase